MGRRLVLAASVLAMMGTAQVTHAQLPIRFGIAGGVSAPAGDLSKVTNSGFNATLLMELRPPLLPVGFRVEGAWNQFGFDKSKTGPIDKNARALSLNANGIVNIPSPTLLKFYAIGGIGMYKIRTASTLGGATYTQVSDNKFGYNIGAGLRLPFPAFEPFLEVRYHQVVDSDGFTFVPVTFGIKF